MLQFILYDQLNTAYIYDDCDHILFLHSSKKPLSPYGPLNLNPFSQQLELDCSKNFIQELQISGKNASRIACESYAEGLRAYCQQHDIYELVVMTPSEPSLLTQFEKIQTELAKQDICIYMRENRQFLITQEAFTKQFPKPPVMETFYRWMRKRFAILMDGDKPQGGKWNYDEENRKFDKKYSKSPPTPQISPDGVPSLTRGEKNSEESANGSVIGMYPTSRTQALAVLQDFITHKLDRFGELEDAMYIGDDVTHHSLISTSLNFGLLTPLEVIKAVESAVTAMNNKEGFIRQVLGWREYMYHRFWFYKDSIYTQNHLNHTKKLPSRFWWPEESTLQMNCVNHVLKTVKNTGYSHHITRLMIIGNFTLLMGYDPHQVNKWFWEMYADAFERVVTPNVLGMSQFADGGNLATKPYISSANYISNMSDYCKTCHYDPKIKTGPKACPMNYLYWNFIDKHRDLFKRQPYIVSNLAKVDIEQVRKEAREFIERF